MPARNIRGLSLFVSLLGVASAAPKPPVTTADCSPKVPIETFTVDFGGNVSNTGRTLEGPLCLEIRFNPIEQYVGLQTSTQTTAGPDLSKVVLGGPSASGPATRQPETYENQPMDLPSKVAAMFVQARNLNADLAMLQSTYAAVSQGQDRAIGEISRLRQTTQFLSGDAAVTPVKNGYAALKNDLGTAVHSAADLAPTDRANSKGEVLLALVQSMEDELNFLPLQFPNGTATTFTCLPPPAPAQAVSWSAWYNMCKDSTYAPLKTILDQNLATAKLFTDASDNFKAVKKQIAIVLYWDALFSRLGLTTDKTASEIQNAAIDSQFRIRMELRCGVLFNQTSNTAVNLVTADLSPTLTGDAPMVKAQTTFVTVSCGTPFAISAGVGFNTIEQKQFAILKSSDGNGGAVNKFGTTGDSKITPVALAAVHVRLADWSRHKYGFYGTLGVGGSLQNQSSASPLQFLPGVSVAFYRIMYLTFGADIGSQTSLAGGFKEGDTVPASITSLDGMLKTTHTVRFGFALTFTKP